MISAPATAKRFVQLLLVLVMACSGPVADAAAETLVLKGRRSIQGPLVKQTATAVFVDLGFDIIRIPRSDIVAIRKTAAPATPRGAGVGSPPADALYTAGDSRLHSTMAGVKAYGPAVVVVRSPGGQGSGFIIHADGYLVTNHHVIHGQKHFSVTRFVQQGPELVRVVYDQVRIVALDSFHDLAVLQIEGEEKTNFPTVLLSPQEPVFGEKVFLIGTPLGLDRTVTEGILSHTSRLFSGSLYLQIDASVNPGNSGGPLFNARGQVIGVVNMGIPSMQGLNFAIPIRHVTFLLDHIDAYAYDQSNPESGFVYLPAPPIPSRIPTKEQE